MAIISSKNLYKFDKDTSLISFVLAILNFDRNYDEHSHLRDFQFNSVPEY